MKRIIGIVMALAMAFIALSAAPAAGENENAFSYWNPEAPALQELIAYVEDVTDESSPNYIPPVDRIAVFDMDGTLCGELYPTYLEYYLLARRIFTDPSYTPDEEMLEFGRLLRDHALDNSFPADMPMQHALAAAKAYAGMTLTQFSDFVTNQLVREVDGFTGMTYATSFYLPMIEVVEYLEDNGFKVYVCSGSDRFICRTFIEGMIDIPYEQIIGMDVAVEAVNQGDTDGLDYLYTSEDAIIRTDELIIKNLKMNKVKQIVQEIGRQPVLSFGNSSGDMSMHNYVLNNNRYKSAAFMLIADDEERDYGNTEKAQGLRERWETAGYHVISMKDDFLTIYGENVVKTGTFHWMEEFAEEDVPETTPAGDGAEPAAEDNASETAGETAAETEGNPDVQYVMFLGTNDRDTNAPRFTQDEAIEALREVLLRHFTGYTIVEAHGGWTDEGKEIQEYSLVIFLSDTTSEEVHAAADELLSVFNQSTVLIQENPTRTEFYSPGR